MVTIKRSKLFNKGIDVRDYEREEIILSGEPAMLLCKQKPNEFMIITPEELSNSGWTTGFPNCANFPLPNNKNTYLLINYPWRNDNKKQTSQPSFSFK